LYENQLCKSNKTPTIFDADVHRDARGCLRRVWGMPAPRDYVVVNGLRYVQPYFHTFDIRVSDKRVGASVLTALDEQVRYQGRVGDGREHWARELAAGRVLLASDVRRRLPTGGDIPNEWFKSPESLDDPVPPDSFFRVVRHVHEPCVGAGVPRVLHEDDKLVFVDKPAGVPTLAGCGPGLQGENNATALLNRTRAETTSSDGDDRHHDELFAVNRIDKPVSGVWILAKGSRLSARVRAALAKPGHETKTYLARVRGDVTRSIRVDAPLSVGDDGRARVDFTASDAKPAVTLVHPIAPCTNDDNGTTTLVACRLERAGRFHQIRCHLASVGHPIANDDAYAGDSLANETHSSVGGTRVYADDDDATLLTAVTDPGTFRASCLECGWAAAAAAGDAAAFNNETRVGCATEWCGRTREEAFAWARNTRTRSGDACGDGGDGSYPIAGTRIDLHSLEYRLLFDGTEYAVRSGDLPGFASLALGAGATVDGVVGALPWAGETLAAGRGR